MKIILYAKVVFCGNLQNISAVFLRMKDEKASLSDRCLFQEVLFRFK